MGGSIVHVIFAIKPSFLRKLNFKMIKLNVKIGQKMSEGEKRSVQCDGKIIFLRHFCSRAFIFGLIFTHNMTLKSKERVDYAGLKNEGSRAKMT